MPKESSTGSDGEGSNVWHGVAASQRLGGITILRVENGQIVEARNNFDLSGMMVQLGPIQPLNVTV